MTATVVGIRHVDFEPEGKGRVVGDKLHVVKAVSRMIKISKAKRLIRFG